MKAMLFADGENLLLRYEEMMREGGVAPMNNCVTHSEGKFVWSTQITHWLREIEFMRVAYYTTYTGDDDALRKLEATIARVGWSSPLSSRHGTLTPRVFKKAKSKKTASVDINITIDVLRHCYHKDVELIYILTGDGDYVPLIQEAMRTGARVFVGAFSSGLNEKLLVVPDEFHLLDKQFFIP